MEWKRVLIVMLAFYAAFSVFSTYTVWDLANSLGNRAGQIPGLRSGEIDIDNVRGTADSLMAVFELDGVANEADAMAMLIPQGTPDYGAELGVSYDDPVGSLERLSGMWESYSAEVRQRNPAVWERFMNLASKPVGISCEFCCGVGPIGIDSSGRSRCGCQHNPALLTLSLWLMENTDMSDKEVLAETLRWKSLFFPRDMVSLAVRAAGGELSTELPGMVGGC